MPAVIETRSIDYVPESERHGGLASQFTSWLGANLQITAIVTGALAVVCSAVAAWASRGAAVGAGRGGTKAASSRSREMARG